VPIVRKGIEDLPSLTSSGQRIRLQSSKVFMENRTGHDFSRAWGEEESARDEESADLEKEDGRCVTVCVHKRV
jgi:hypothetical protein